MKHVYTEDGEHSAYRIDLHAYSRLYSLFAVYYPTIGIYSTVSCFFFFFFFPLFLSQSIAWLASCCCCFDVSERIVFLFVLFLFYYFAPYETFHVRLRMN